MTRIRDLWSPPRLSPLLRDSLVSMTVRVVGLAVAFLSHLLLSRILGVWAYGVYVIALSWALVLVIPARLGLDNAALRFATIYREEGRFAAMRGFLAVSLVAICTLSLLVAGAMAGLKILRPSWLASVSWTMLAGVAALILPLALLGWAAALMRTANRIFESQFYEQVLRPALLIAAIGAAAALGFKLDSFGALALTVASAVLALAAIATRVAIVFAPVRSERSDYAEKRLWLGVSGVMLLQALAQELLNQIDVLMLGALADATAAAHFSAAARLASLVPFGLVAIVAVSGPRIASAHRRGNFAELAEIGKINARFSFAFACVTAAIIALIGRPVLTAFGPTFGEAYVPLLVMLLGGLANAFTGSVGYFLLMTGRQVPALFVLTATLLVNIPLNLMLIPTMGATGAAITSTVCLFVWNFAMLFMVRRILGIDASIIALAPRDPARSRP